MQLKPQVMMQKFDDGALLLWFDGRRYRMFELNAVAAIILTHINAQHPVQHVATLVADTFDVPEHIVLKDISSLFEELFAYDLIETVQFTADHNQEGETIMSKTEATIYTVNPDVTLRETDESGGLLFNPDTRELRALNATGLHVWKSCTGKSMTTIANSVAHEFEGVTPEEALQDVKDFIENMLAIGFVGVVEFRK